jgi:N-acetylglucosamine kinase-like BadF-type ATPase
MLFQRKTMRYFLGVDVGSSKTHALLADENGQAVGFGTAGAGNWQGVGYDGLQAALHKAVDAACAMADIQKDEIAGAGFGVAGYDFPSTDRQPHLETLATLGLVCPVDVVNDGINGLLAAAPNGIGVSLAAGSGVNCCGRGPNGEEGRIVGNGVPFGEFGGGSQIVWKGLHQVNYAWIQRIPPTALTQIYLDAVGASDVLDLMDGLSYMRYQLSHTIAVEIFAAAQNGDAAALDVVHWTAEELAWLAMSVTRQIGMEAAKVEIVLSGSIFKAGEILIKPMQAQILEHVPQAQFTHLTVPPVVGATLLGMEVGNFNGYPVREKLIRTTREITAL